MSSRHGGNLLDKSMPREKPVGFEGEMFSVVMMMLVMMDGWVPVMVHTYVPMTSKRYLDITYLGFVALFLTVSLLCSIDFPVLLVMPLMVLPFVGTDLASFGSMDLHPHSKHEQQHRCSHHETRGLSS